MLPEAFVLFLTARSTCSTIPFTLSLISHQVFQYHLIGCTDRKSCIFFSKVTCMANDCWCSQSRLLLLTCIQEVYADHADLAVTFHTSNKQTCIEESYCTLVQCLACIMCNACATEHVPCSIAEWKLTVSFVAGCSRKGEKGAVRAGGTPQDSE